MDLRARSLNRCRLPAVMLFLLLGALAGRAGAQPAGAAGNPGIYPKPLAPHLPPVGGSYVDPTFGTTIVRVTDATTAPAGVSLNSAAQDTMFNRDGTLFYLPHREHGTFVYALDRQRGTATKLGALPAWVTPDGAAWDPLVANRLYVALISTQSREVWQLDLTPSPWSVRAVLLFSFPEVPAGGYPSSRLQLSPDGRHLALIASTTGGQDTYDHIVVWDRQTGGRRVANTVARAEMQAPMHSMVMDTSGEYLIVEGVPWGASWVYHHPTDRFSRGLTHAEGFGGHKAPGQRAIVHPGADAGQWMRRSLADVDDAEVILVYPRKAGKANYYEDSHSSKISPAQTYVQSRYVADFSWRFLFQPYTEAIYTLPGFLAYAEAFAAPEQVRHQGLPVAPVGDIPAGPNQWWYDPEADALYVWLPGGADPRGAALSVFDWRPFMEEIVQVFHDGSRWTWQRLAHHRGHVDETFGSTPRANADPTGRFVLFKSNWDYSLRAPDGRSREDAFLLLVPPRPGSGGPPTTPSVAFLSPANGATVAGVLTIAVSVRNAERLEIRVGSDLIATSSPPAPSVVWNTATTPRGRRIVKASASDAAGHLAEATLTVFVADAVKDRSAPTVSIVSPARGQTVAVNIPYTIEAAAFDDIGVTLVEFYVGPSRICTAVAPPYTCAWTPTKRQTYYLSAKAYDAARKVRISATIPAVAH